MAKKQTYLVAVDGSEWGERAARAAVNLAKQTGATVYLFSVIPWSGFRPLTMDELESRSMVRTEEEDTLKAEVLEPLAKAHADSGVTIETGYTWGHPVDRVRKEIKEKKIHMVFVGRRGRSQVLDMIMGSVASNLAHSVGIPIVLVP